MYFLFSIWKNQPNTMQFQFRDQNFYSDILQLCRTCAKIYSLACLCNYCFLLSSSSIHGNSKIHSTVFSHSKLYLYIHPPATYLNLNNRCYSYLSVSATNTVSKASSRRTNLSGLAVPEGYSP